MASTKTLFDNVTLTTAYTGNQVEFDCYGDIIVFLDYTKGAETGMAMKVEISPDNGVTWYDRVNSAGVLFNTFADFLVATGKYMSNISKKPAGNGELFGPLKGERVRISVQGTAGANGTLTMKALDSTVR